MHASHFRRTAAAVTLLAATSARADFDGIQIIWDPFALDGVTPLIDLPGYEGETVLNVYASLTSPADQCLGVVGSHANPFWVSTADGSGFVNERSFGSDTPPPGFLLKLIPAVNWDSFYTIGLSITGPSDGLVTAPGTPGPNTDPWPPSPDPEMAWIVPQEQNGMPTPQSLAGPDLRVLIMRLVIPFDTFVNGQFGVLIRSGGSTMEHSASFSTSCVGPCCGVYGDCSFQTSDDCMYLGGVFIGCGGGLTCDACPEATCLADVNGDATVDVADLVAVVLAWGSCTGCAADVNGDGVVNTSDLITVILDWGPCP